METHKLQIFMLAGVIITILRLFYTVAIITSKEQEDLTFRTYYTIPEINNATLQRNEPFLKGFTPLIKEYYNLHYSTILFVEAALTSGFYILGYAFFDRFVSITTKYNNLFFQFFVYSISAPMFYVCTLMLCGMVNGVSLITFGVMMAILQYNGAVIFMENGINSYVMNTNLLISGCLLFIALMLPLCIQFKLATDENTPPSFVYWLFSLLILFYTSFGVVMIVSNYYMYDIKKVSALYIILDISSKIAISVCLLQIYF